MRRAILSAIIAAGSAIGACPTGTTPVQDTVYAPAGPNGATPLFSGTITISIAKPIAVAGRTYGQIPVPYQVLGGAFSACIAPNDAALPQKTNYVVKYEFHGAYSASWSELWYVPTSTGALTIAQVRGVTMPSGIVVSQASWSVLPAFDWFNLSPYTWSRIVP
jgi:hypothetical protein